MKTRLILSAGLLLGLSGCATYDYVGGGSGGYYHGSPQVQRTYPYGYPYGAYGYGAYGYGGYYGGYGSYGYPYPVYRPPHRPPHNGHRPPPQGNGHTPPRPGNGQPPHPPPANGSGKAPWRDLDRLQRPQPRPGKTESRPIRRPVPQAVAPARPVVPQRAAPERRPSQTRSSRNVRQVEL